MSSSDVRSIQSLQRLRTVLVSLGGQWDEVLRQIRFTSGRLQEHFHHDWPAYWNDQTAKAEAALSEALDHLSRLRSGGSGQSHPATEAQQRVNAAHRRLAKCRDMQARAKRIAVTVDEACQRLAGPTADVTQHAEANLPRAAAELATLIEHLSRYAEIQPVMPQAEVRNDPLGPGGSGGSGGSSNPDHPGVDR